MGRVARPALAYFAIVFAVGAVLGAAREMVVLPRFGPMGAVMLEAPAMLLACWLAARWAVRRFAVVARVRMGLVAFGLLMAAELVGALALRGMTVPEWVAHFAQPEGFLALSLFVAFGAMPVIVKG